MVLKLTEHNMVLKLTENKETENKASCLENIALIIVLQDVRLLLIAKNCF